MIIRAGFQSFEFQRAYELPKPLTFASHDDALKWLKQLGFLDPQTILGFRECLGRFSDDPECFRLSDHEAIERMAALLYSRRVVVVAREQGGGSASPTPKTAPIPIPFPLSERAPRAPAVPPKPAPPDDPPTFEPRLDAVVQAAALVAAANEGKPFCAECPKPKAAAAAGTSN
jgi:hypothetical protein